MNDEHLLRYVVYAKKRGENPKKVLEQAGWNPKKVEAALKLPLKKKKVSTYILPICLFITIIIYGLLVIV